MRRACLVSLLALLLMQAGPAGAADGLSTAAERIRSDADLRGIMAGRGLEPIETERLDRLAERTELTIDRARARVGTLPLAAEHELGHAAQDLNTLKTRAPYHPEIPLLERHLSRARRLAR